MNIISGTNVDLITPFPPSETRRVFGWSKCYRTFVDSDLYPKGIEDYTSFIASALALPATQSWGVIDKNQLTNARHEAPLVGVVMFEPAQYGGFLHFASARKAFKMGLLDEALELALAAIFSTNPSALRVTCCMDERNYPVKVILRSRGFAFEGAQRSAFLQAGEPRALAMFGLVRPESQAAPVELPAEVPQSVGWTEIEVALPPLEGE